jgi:hypothetical protein
MDRLIEKPEMKNAHIFRYLEHLYKASSEESRVESTCWKHPAYSDLLANNQDPLSQHPNQLINNTSRYSDCNELQIV